MSNSKEKRKTFLVLRDGKNFQKDLYNEVWANDKDIHPDDYLIALDELKKIAGISSK